MKTTSARNLVLLCAAALALPSCVLSGFVRASHQVPFDESAFTAYRSRGSATVSGRLFATWEGKPSDAGGVPVTLLPVTRYTTEMVQRELGDGVQLFPSDSRFRKYVRKTTASAQGGFIFTNVPAGEYYVAGEVGWDSPGEPGEYTHQWVCERVTVGSGQSVNVMVSHNPQHGNSPVNNFFTLE